MQARTLPAVPTTVAVVARVGPLVGLLVVQPEQDLTQAHMVLVVAAGVPTLARILEMEAGAEPTVATEDRESLSSRFRIR